MLGMDAAELEFSRQLLSWMVVLLLGLLGLVGVLVGWIWNQHSKRLDRHSKDLSKLHEEVIGRQELLSMFQSMERRLMGELQYLRARLDTISDH